MINWGNFISQCFNGLVLGALLALISSGLTIIYGTLGVLNLAHGALFMLGGYAGWVAFTHTGSFVVAVIAGALFVMVVGLLIERTIIRYFYSRPAEDQLLVTFGLGIVFVELVRFFFGSLSQKVPPPEPLNRIVEALRSLAPGHRLDALTPFPPMPLLPILQRQGFAWRIDELPTGHARVSICRKEDASVLLTADPLR